MEEVYEVTASDFGVLYNGGSYYKASRAFRESQEDSTGNTDSPFYGETITLKAIDPRRDTILTLRQYCPE